MNTGIQKLLLLILGVSVISVVEGSFYASGDQSPSDDSSSSPLRSPRTIIEPKKTWIGPVYHQLCKEHPKLTLVTFAGTASLIGTTILYSKNTAFRRLVDKYFVNPVTKTYQDIKLLLKKLREESKKIISKKTNS